MTVLGIGHLFIAVFIDHILHSVDLVPTIIRVNKNILPPLSIVWQHHRDWQALHRGSLLGLLDLTSHHLVALDSFLRVVKIIQSLRLSFFLLFRLITCRSYRFLAWIVGRVCLEESGVAGKGLRDILWIRFDYFLRLTHKSIPRNQRLWRLLIPDHASRL